MNLSDSEYPNSLNILFTYLDHPSSACQRQKFQYLKVLGGGWFGQAVEAEGRHLVEDEHQSRCVVKILRPDATNLELIRFLEEVRCYRDLNHSNILNLVGVCLESYPKLVVLQHCSKGDLKSYLLDQQKIGYIPTVSALMKMSLDVSNGIYAIHNKGMIHPDFAARNCLVTSKGTVVIGDYGISQELHKADYYEIGGAVLPVRWVAPEDVFVSELGHDTVVAEYKASEKGNVWSLGVIFWEIFELGNQPFHSYSDEAVIESVIISQKIVLDRPKRQPSDDTLYQLMLQCFSAQPDCRPPVENIIANLSGLLAVAMRSDVDFDTRWDRLQRQFSAFSDSASADESLFGMPNFEESLKAEHSKARVASDDDLAYAEKVNEALRTLDQALNLEEGEIKPKFDLGLAVLSNPFGPTTLETQQLNSLTPSYLEVEERAERGEFENLVREKSRSVTDLMRLTHVENGSESLSFTDKEPLPDKEFPDKISPLKFIVNTSDTVLNSSYFESPVRDNVFTSTPQGSYHDISDQKDFSSINLSMSRQDIDIPDLLEVSPERRSETLDLISNAPELSFKVENDVGCEDSCEQVLPSCEMEGSSHVIEINYNAGKPLLTPILEESQSLSSESSLKEVGYNQNHDLKEVGEDFVSDSLKKVSSLPKTYSGVENSNTSYLESNPKPPSSPSLRNDTINNYSLMPTIERQFSISLSQKDADDNTKITDGEFSSKMSTDNIPTEGMAIIPEFSSNEIFTTGSLPQSLDHADSESFENEQQKAKDISTVLNNTWAAVMSNKKNANDILSKVSSAKELLLQCESTILGEMILVSDALPSKANDDNQEHSAQTQTVGLGELECGEEEVLNSKERSCSPESGDDITESKDWTSDVSSTDDEFDTAGDGSISTGGIFIWKEPLQNENEEKHFEDDEFDEQKEEDLQSFVPSTWNSSRTPTKSALKSPEHTLESSLWEFEFKEIQYKAKSKDV
ncbi:hypothetical protein QYM36_006019 [Artemia franciscana]|uniref:Protein kinase domain-containing protein n=1 Tax=Artemia franciscana TaxID=6661 RepID=A0AA88IBM3_ARTSF|nr:hypothetical protein QYM36_006019 [Artemia franciscana]